MFERKLFYTERFSIPRNVFTKDAAPEKIDPELEKKLAKVVALLEKLATGDRPAVADVMGAKQSQRQENARRLRKQGANGMKFLQDAIRKAAYEAACEGSQAAYAARNPHKAQQDEPRETRVQYPHKPRQREPWEDRLYTTDRAMTICEQCEAAYAARNPHKRKEVR